MFKHTATLSQVVTKSFNPFEKEKATDFDEINENKPDQHVLPYQSKLYHSLEQLRLNKKITIFKQ